MGVHAEAGAALPGVESDTVQSGFALIVDRALETVCVALMLVALGVSCLQVALRYGFHSGLPWPEELAIWSFCWAVFLGMGLATGRDAHIAIDSFSRLLPPRGRTALGFFNHVVIAASSVMLVTHGFEYVSRSIAASPALQWPMKYFFLAVPVGGLFNVFFLVWPRPGRSHVRGLAVVVAGLPL